MTIRPRETADRPSLAGLAPGLLSSGGMRTTTFDALLRDLELLFSVFEPSLATIRAAFAGLAALAAIWFF